MCRSIKTLRVREVPATDEEMRAAALQFVRKVSGFRQPSARHAEAFESAVDDVHAACRRLLESITTEMLDGPSRAGHHSAHA